MKRSTNEKIVGWLILVSLAIFLLGLLFPCLSSWFGAPVFNHLAVFCWMTCVLPFMSLQFFIPSGIYVYFFSDLNVVLRVIIFWFLAPIGNLVFFFWAGTVFKFLPLNETFSQAMPILLACSSGLSWALFGLGVTFRLIKQKLINEGRS